MSLAMQKYHLHLYPALEQWLHQESGYIYGLTNSAMLPLHPFRGHDIGPAQFLSSPCEVGWPMRLLRL